MAEGECLDQTSADHNYCLYINTKNYSKVWIDYFVYVKLHPHLCLSLSKCIKDIAFSVKTGETVYFRNHGGYYYHSVSCVCKKKTVIKQIQIIYDIFHFVIETLYGKSHRKKIIFFSHKFRPLKKSPR